MVILHKLKHKKLISLIINKTNKGMNRKGVARRKKERRTDDVNR
jgi:hypothetical protein